MYSESVYTCVFDFTKSSSVSVCVCVCLRRCILESICGIGLWKWFGIHMRGFEFLAVNVFQGDD